MSEHLETAARAYAERLEAIKREAEISAIRRKEREAMEVTNPPIGGSHG